ncbi:GAF domain-containing protein [Pleionea litopenaei]|uniref:GAF domain-containing protein n=1 Tax=Pleionea litopenaei TaxID=3070815 RepID=A0AA51RV06_9GAMM|nr:GAF domain-containing protein [Pleionea sp. HL-JVS1]WMS87989.1 GAF domain-containing protein [Pleionea sp. HL-JVS1]
MYALSADVKAYESDKAGYYRTLSAQLKSLLEVERDAVTNMAQTAAFIYSMIPELNWAGFYLVRQEDKLTLGPYQGRVACVHIPFGTGVCGTVAANREAICVNDVHSFEGHIACDSASNSEIVVPLVKHGQLIGVLDIDSPVKDRFTPDDLEGFKLLAEIFLQASDI